MKIEASKRLAVSVSAATDTKGAVKYLKEVFSQYLLGVKKVWALDDDALAASFKGPKGDISVAISLSSTGGVYFEFLRYDGLDLTHDADTRDMSIEFTLKGKKNDAKSMMKSLKSIEKQVKEAHQFLLDAEAVQDWMQNFHAAVETISSQMDKKRKT